MKSFGRLGTILLTLSAAVNITLAWQVRSLRHSLELSRVGDRLIAGDSLPKMALVDADGARIQPGEPGVRYVLYVVAPRCSWCEKNNETIRYLAKLAGEKYRFAGISTRLTGLRELADHLGPGFPIYGDPAVAQLRSLKVGGTPTMTSLSADGRVDRVWHDESGDPVDSATPLP